MSLLAAVVASFGQTLDPIVADWASITVVWPGTTQATNANLTLTWTTGGARTLSYNYVGLNVVEYSINSGSWLTTSPFSFSSGDTLQWRYTGSSSESDSVSVSDDTRAVVIDSFNVTAVNFP